MTDARISTNESPISCPVPSPDGLPCAKTIHPGWTVEEGHGGGHFWAPLETVAILDGGHYDTRAAISMQPFAGHRSEDCPGDDCQHKPA
jgi:hypothetical protein